MAWHSLPVLDHAVRDPRGRVRLPPDRLPGRGGPGEPRRAASQRRHAPGPRHRRRAGRPRPARELWPRRRLDDFAEFAYEPRGGYGDGHQTAQAFATAAPPRRGHASDRTARSRRSRCRATECVRCRLGDGQTHRCRPGGRGRRAVVERPGRRASGSTCRSGPSGPRCCSSTPAGPSPGVPVFSDLVSLQYVRAGGPGRSWWATATTPIPSGPIPTPTASGPSELELAPVDPEVRAPLPRS